MALTINFGDVFRYKEQEFVYLARVDEILYAAQILDKHITEQLQAVDDKYSKKVGHTRTDNSLLYSYVILQTDEFLDRAALVGYAGDNAASRPDLYYDLVGCTVNEEDIKALKEEILRDNSPVPKGLKKAIQDLQ